MLNCPFHLFCSCHYFLFSTSGFCNSQWRTCILSSTCFLCSSKAFILLLSTIVMLNITLVKGLWYQIIKITINNERKRLRSEESSKERGILIVLFIDCLFNTEFLFISDYLTSFFIATNCHCLFNTWLY